MIFRSYRLKGGWARRCSSSTAGATGATGATGAMDGQKRGEMQPIIVTGYEWDIIHGICMGYAYNCSIYIQFYVYIYMIIYMIIYMYIYICIYI